MPFGLVVALLVGFSAGFVCEYLEHTFKRPKDVERFLELPVIFSIPANALGKGARTADRRVGRRMG